MQFSLEATEKVKAMITAMLAVSEMWDKEGFNDLEAYPLDHSFNDEAVGLMHFFDPVLHPKMDVLETEEDIKKFILTHHSEDVASRFAVDITKGDNTLHDRGSDGMDWFFKNQMLNTLNGLGTDGAVAYWMNMMKLRKIN